MTPRTIEEVPGSARPTVRRSLDRSRSTGRYRKGSHFWEDTNNNARVWPSTRRQAFRRRSYIPEPRDRLSSRRSAAGRPTSSPSSTAPTRSTTRRRSKRNTAASKRLRPRVVHVEPLLRQLRPGRLVRRPTTRTSSSDRRTSVTARGRQLWNIKDGDLRGDRRNVFKVYGSLHARRGTRRRARSSSRSPAAVGDVELRAVQSLTDLDVATRFATPNRPDRGAPTGTSSWI